MRHPTRNVLAVLLAGVLIGCSTVAITGRSQLNLVSDADMVKYANESYARFIGSAEAKHSVLKASESPDAAAAIAAVDRVSRRIIDAAGLRGKYPWQVVVVRSSDPNAFVMPNGKIVVYTGILPITRDDTGLAVVLGHEVAHVVAHHAAERLSQNVLTQATLEAVDSVGNASGAQNAPLIAAALGLGAQYGVLLPYSRQHESEADRIGQIYMARAGYDPAEAIALWTRMAAGSGKSRAEFMSTHPASETRQAQLRQWLPEAQRYYRDRNRPLPTSLDEPR